MVLSDLRQGRLDIVPNYFTVDMPFYREHIADFVPDQIIDIHTHAGLGHPRLPGDPDPRYWPGWIDQGAEMTVPNLLQALLILFPGKDVTPVVLGGGSRTDIDAPTEYLIEELRNYPHIYGMMRSIPDWPAKEIVARYERGRFVGLKPYLNMAPPDILPEQITIFDILPPHHIQVAEERGWIIMLHIPRAERLADPCNIDQLKEIADTYPEAKIILAHIGRAYCPRFAQQGFAALGDTAKFYYWDFSANFLQEAMELLIECASPNRILYGTDLPILAARARRICEGDNYINLMREADWQDSHTRLAPPQEREQITFMVYEEIAAFRRAAGKKGLDQQAIEDIFYNNARALLTSAE
jgi:predicted TIM-barrel fold metal-dependent hydrolase